MTRKLSTIETTVLGIAWKRSPCTIYVIAKELSGSTSAFYKEKASTVYPLADRLISQGLLKKIGTQGSRAERQIEITEAGIAALRDWLQTPISIADASNTVDLLRLKVFYLGTLPAEERKVFIDSAIESLYAHAEQTKSVMNAYQSAGDPFSELATLGTLFETEARINWISAIQAKIESLEKLS